MKFTEAAYCIITWLKATENKGIDDTENLNAELDALRKDNARLEKIVIDRNKEIESQRKRIVDLMDSERAIKNDIEKTGNSLVRAVNDLKERDTKIESLKAENERLEKDKKRMIDISKNILAAESKFIDQFRTLLRFEEKPEPVREWITPEEAIEALKEGKIVRNRKWPAQVNGVLIKNGVLVDCVSGETVSNRRCEGYISILSCQYGDDWKIEKTQTFANATKRTGLTREEAIEAADRGCKVRDSYWEQGWVTKDSEHPRYIDEDDMYYTKEAAFGSIGTGHSWEIVEDPNDNK